MSRRDAPPRAPKTTLEDEAGDAAEYGDDMYQFYDPAKGWLGKQSTNFEVDTSGYGGAAVAHRRQQQAQRYVGFPAVYERRAPQCSNRINPPFAAQEQKARRRLG